ncbi:MAG: TIGR04255 family protein [Chloroflexi bacterium]|nr:TIGR04255 family protein [Chloroflexota bacterium]
MPFKESQRVVYDKNPLVEVICQFKFPTILRIGSGEVAGFQDRVRADYPLYERKEPAFQFTNVPKEFSAIFEQLPFPKSLGIASQKFMTKDKTRSISLSQDFLSVAETDYKRWEMFKVEVEKAEQALRQEFRPAFYSRIGLRYKDLIIPQAIGLGGKKWNELLQNHIVGELGDQDVADNISEITTRSIIQLSEVPGAIVVLSHGLVKDQSGQAAAYLLDADFSLEKPAEGIDGAFEVLEEFHGLAGRLFRWAIRDTLHQAMGPEAIE